MEHVQLFSVEIQCTRTKNEKWYKSGYSYQDQGLYYKPIYRIQDKSKNGQQWCFVYFLYLQS